MKERESKSVRVAKSRRSTLYSAELLTGLAERLGACGALHVSLIGSALAKPLEEAKDLDVYVVTPRLDEELFHRLSEAGDDAIVDLVQASGSRWRLETRRGPFKPSPEDRLKQLHLLIEDRDSLHALSRAVLLQYAVSGALLYGAPLDQIVPSAVDGEAIWEQTRSELEHLFQALRLERIPYREWTFAPRARLVDCWQEPTTSWSRWCLLRHVAVMADVHCLHAALADPRGGKKLFSAGRLLAQLDGLDWRSIDRHWCSWQSRLQTSLASRLDVLGP